MLRFWLWIQNLSKSINLDAQIVILDTENWSKGIQVDFEKFQISSDPQFWNCGYISGYYNTNGGRGKVLKQWFMAFKL